MLTMTVFFLFRSLHPVWQNSVVNLWPNIWNHNQPVGSLPWQTWWATCLYLKRVEFGHSRYGMELQYSSAWYQNKYYLCIYILICLEWKVPEIHVLALLYVSVRLSVCLRVTTKEQMNCFCGIGLFYQNLLAYFQFWLKLYNSNGHFMCIYLHNHCC